MTGFISIVLVLAGLIFFHELGHFLAARSLGIGVQTFSLGFGPAIFSWKGKKTKYQLSCIPLGGYVSLVGEQDDKSVPEPFTEAESFSRRPAWHRFIVVSAGPLFNFILAAIIYMLLFFMGKMTLPEIANTLPDSPAAQAELRAGDFITNINGQDIYTWEDTLMAVQRNQGKDLNMTFLRDGKEEQVVITPALKTVTDDEGKEHQMWLVGIQASMLTQQFSLPDSIKLGINETVNKTKLISNAVVDLVTGKGSVKDLGGPVMVAQVVHKQATYAGFFAVLKLAAVLSINLGLLNLLPIPALDGGHVVFCLVEMVFRRPVPVKIQAISSYVGLSLLLMLMVFATFMDISRIFG